MEEIIRYTEMSSFNQRIQTMREAEIDVQNRMEGGRSSYRMFTDPLSFNWDNYMSTRKIPRQRIRHTGKKAVKVDVQETLL